MEPPAERRRLPRPTFVLTAALLAGIGAVVVAVLVGHSSSRTPGTAAEAKRVCEHATGQQLKSSAARFTNEAARKDGSFWRVAGEAEDSSGAHRTAWRCTASLTGKYAYASVVVG
jgi:hypothetical protein